MTTTVGTAADRTEGRGRDADAPSDIPPHGWLDILRRTMAEFSSDRILAVAAGVTFYALLAIFPGLAALVSLIGFFADPAVVSAQLNALSGLVPGGATEIIGNQVERLSAQTGSSLSFALVFGIAVALWSASSGMKAMFDALNVVYGEDEKRSFVELSALALAFTIGAIVFLLLAFGAVVVLPIALGYVGLGGMTQLLIQLLRWPLLFAAAALALAAFYRFGPSREDAEWRWISWGSALAALLWVVASVLFSWYVQNFGSFNETYGSLGAVIGFMTWMWLSATIFLLGAELNSEIEHQTARDTTTGPEQPCGKRGAMAADTVAGPPR